MFEQNGIHIEIIDSRFVAYSKSLIVMEIEWEQCGKNNGIVAFVFSFQ